MDLHMKQVKILALICTMVLGLAVLAGCGTAGAGATKYIVLEEDFGGEQYGVGFRKEDIALGLEVQKYLDAMMEDGTMQQISQKWFGKDATLKDAAYLKESKAPEGDTSLQKILEKGELVMGLDDGFPPMGFRDQDQEIKGYDIDLAKEVAKRMGVKLKLQPIDWDSKELELNGGKIDCIWNGMSITDERLAAMYFARPYINNKQIIIVPENSDIKTKSDLKGKIVGLQRGSSALNAVSADPIKSDIKEIVEHANNPQVYSDLKTGRLDAMVVDEVVGRYLLEKDKA